MGRGRASEIQERAHPSHSRLRPISIYLAFSLSLSLSLKSQPMSKWMEHEKGRRECSAKENFSVAYSFRAHRRRNGIKRRVGTWVLSKVVHHMPPASHKKVVRNSEGVKEGYKSRMRSVATLSPLGLHIHAPLVRHYIGKQLRGNSAHCSTLVRSLSGLEK